MFDREEARRKAEELVGKMTVEERASQLKYDAPAIKRLGVPAYNWWSEALHGVARAGVATSFPQAIAMAAMFDEEYLRKIGDAIATEGRAKYNAYAAKEDRDIFKGLTFWSPNVNIFRDPRWGRGHETYGEDPYLTSRLGVAFVKGLQGDGKVMKSAACAKHYAVHSGPEIVRHEFNAVVSKKDLWETYLPGFEACVKEADVESVMGAYNRTNGEPCCGSKTLICDILRDKWQFQGHFVSDCWALLDFHTTHNVTNVAKESAAMAIKAGCDLNCGNTYLHILKAYKDGLVTEEDITRSAVRLFTTRYLLGIMETSEYDKIPYEKVECEEHLEMAQEAARKSIVLLKNDGLLPLQKEKLKTIGVVGPNANNKTSLIGNYHGTSSRYITVLEGIQNEVEGYARVMYSDGAAMSEDHVEELAWDHDRVAEAVTVAEHSDVVVVVVGLDENIEGEEKHFSNRALTAGDKEGLGLPHGQQVMLERVLQVGKPTVVVLMSGSAIDLNYADEHAAAVVEAWYPGARGGKAVADVLFGHCSPSGKLPITFYRSLDNMPDFEDYSMKNRTYRYIEEPALYAFGYGLTYSKTEVLRAKIKGDISMEHGFVLQVEMANIGDCDTEEVLQIYMKDNKSPLAVRNHKLCGMKRVFLKKGERHTVEITVGSEAFQVVNEEGEKVVDSNDFTLYAGISQPDERSVSLTGTKPVEIPISLE